MPGDRVTVSLDEDAKSALEGLIEQTDESRSEMIREAIAFYAANFDAASTDRASRLEEYDKMLTGGEHVLLDIDFLHCFLDHVTENGDPTDEFVEAIDRVSDYHGEEFADRFSDLGELLEWLSLCGFLTVRRTTEDTYQVVFPSADIRWFMTRFIERSTEYTEFDVTVKPGVAKLLLVEE